MNRLHNKFIIPISALVLLTNSSLSAETKSIFSDFQAKYKIAKSLYAHHNYQRAYMLFLQLVEKAPRSLQANFYLGRSAFEIGKYDEAMAAYDRVLILDTKNIRAHLEIARIYYILKEYSLALSELDIVLKHKLPAKVKQNILSFKQTVLQTQHDKRQKLFFAENFSFGISYDDNVNNDIGNVSFLIPAYNIFLEGNHKKADSYLFVNGRVNSFYDFGERGGWGIAAALSLYDSSNKRFKRYNSTMLATTITPIFATTEYKIEFPFTYNKLFLDGKSNSYTYSLGISGSYFINPTSLLSSSYTYSSLRNSDNSQYNYRTDSLSISYQKSLGKTPLKISLSTGYQKYTKATNSTRTDISGYALNYNLKLSRKIYKKLSGYIGYSYFTKKYKDVDVLFQNKREDSQKSYSAGLTYAYSKTFKILLNGQSLKNHSNQKIFNYDKNRATLTFSKDF